MFCAFPRQKEFCEKCHIDTIPNKKSIGLIEKVEGRYRATTSKTSNILFANSLESSINDLLSYFTLHEK